MDGEPRCTHCGWPIVWCRTENGRAMPLDSKPNPAGNVYVQRVRGKLVGHVRSKGAPRPRGVAFMPHFATCEVLNRGRKPKEEKQPCKPEPEPEPSLFD